ncbi:ethanolamine utilization protein EutP [Caldalkalibacillus uzonensis]|uniref:Ethanolamine utilization protein EutP n=1 Tax=Caldalkalibacillus uzonensis TaxID=353224 RepID=A0ABU0CS96_9BACI|nr:EutP/PduV family microcompartment system protein [Caldalkalibacillus uzonensis]MDQ0338734.1 ethanolamine utilization protein EutP [Caldalkalibacillus uzonensis]
MPRKRAMMIGAVGSGKSTLTNALLERQEDAVKTQALHYQDWIVDTPGEYTENPMFYKTIMVTMLEVTHVLFLQDATNPKTIFPPGFSSGISKLAIGVVTKIDAPNANIERAVNQLKQALIRGPIILTSVKTNVGIDQLRDLIRCETYADMKAYVQSSEYEGLYFHDQLYKAE